MVYVIRLLFLLIFLLPFLFFFSVEKRKIAAAWLCVLAVVLMLLMALADWLSESESYADKVADDMQKTHNLLVDNLVTKISVERYPVLKKSFDKDQGKRIQEAIRTLMNSPSMRVCQNIERLEFTADQSTPDNLNIMLSCTHPPQTIGGITSTRTEMLTTVDRAFNSPTPLSNAERITRISDAERQSCINRALNYLHQHDTEVLADSINPVFGTINVMDATHLTWPLDLYAGRSRYSFSCQLEDDTQPLVQEIQFIKLRK